MFHPNPRNSLVEKTTVSGYSFYVSTTTFKVKMDSFEGPLELLLDLIEKRKLHISDVSLAAVADDYISHIRDLESFPLAGAAHFVLVASTLLLIKSKSLLPMLELSIEEQEDIDELERRLKLHKQYKELAEHVSKQFGKQMLFSTQSNLSYDPLFTPDESATTKSLHEAVQGLIAAFPQPKTLSKVVVDKVMSLEEMITRMTDRVQSALKLKFSESVEKGGTEREQKLNVVISFLAMLELVKQGAVLVNQEAAFADIDIESQSVTTPNYS